MRRLALLAVLVTFAAGCGWLSGLVGGPPQPHTHKGLLGPVIGPTLHLPDAAARARRWVKLEHLPKKAIPGAVLFTSAGCTACHVYAGSGGSNLNAPPLTAIGRRRLGIRFQIAHLKCPSCVRPGSPMPPFGSLGRRRLRRLAVFLEASKGIH
jgi:hypothetical protein